MIVDVVMSVGDCFLVMYTLINGTISLSAGWEYRVVCRPFCVTVSYSHMHAPSNTDMHNIDTLQRAIPYIMMIKRAALAV